MQDRVFTLSSSQICSEWVPVCVPSFALIPSRAQPLLKKNIIIIIIIIISLCVHCRTKASPKLLHSSLSAACLFQDTPTNLPISSLHLVLYLPCFLLPSLDCHSVHLLSPSLNVYCPCPIFFLLIVVKMCLTLVCSLIHDALFLSLHVMPNTILYILL